MADKAANQDTQQVDDKGDTDDKTSKTGADDAGGGDDKGGDDKPSELETRAHRMGWRPQAEYTESGRDPSKWVDAAEFVKRGEESLPVLRERLRKQDKIIEAQNGKMEEGNKLLRELVSHQQAQTKAAVAKAVKDLKAERREAAKTGDDERVEELSDEIEKTEKSLTVVAKTEEKTEDNKPPAEIVEWAEANASWFKTDKRMNAYAVAAYGELMADTSLTDKQRLAKVKADVVKTFPDKFPSATRDKIGTVESGSGGSSMRKTAKGWADIPAEERNLAQRLIKQGACKNEAEYAKLYWQQGAAA